MLFSLFLFLLFFACVALLYNEGMWSNAIRFINVVIAGLLATNYYEPLATWLTDWQPSYMFAWDFLSIWILFGAIMAAFRALTDLASQVNVKFLKIADQIGGVAFAIFVGWAVVCFTATTMHTAPLSKNFFFGSFHAEEPLFFMGISPDRQWLGMMQSLSRGPYASAMTDADKAKGLYGERAGDAEWERGLRVFDRNAEFLPKYTTFRAKLETHMNKTTTNSLRIGSVGPW